MASSSSSSPPENKITLKASDGEEFVVDQSVAIQSITIKNMVDSDCAPSDTAIPVVNVTGKILALVIEFCKTHADIAATEEKKSEFNTQFIENHGDMNSLFELILAANYLEVKELIGLVSQAIADMIKDLDHREVRKIFNVVNDFTEEEEAATRAENEWAFEEFEKGKNKTNQKA